MADIDDVAAAILQRLTPPVDTYKLQKLAYYSQAWHLAWEGKALFEDCIEAWAAGPVVRSLYAKHRGRFQVWSWPDGDPAGLDDSETSTVDAVVGAYGRFTGAQLSTLTHREAPWRSARKGLPPGAPSSAEITQESMYAYYSKVSGDDDAEPVEAAALD